MCNCTVAAVARQAAAAQRVAGSILAAPAQRADCARELIYKYRVVFTNECLSVNHAETTNRILMIFGIRTRYELIWVIEYCLSHGNVAKPLTEAKRLYPYKYTV
uniref:SFRICE_032380 n=1 Tax=Spodoptera frugiperda TaxID=7108 RepID=A0A2H1WCY0_SPOFR